MDQSEESLQALLITDLDRNFERLVLTYQDQLYAYVLSLARSSQAAEEILQTALERAYFALKKYPAQRIRVLRLEPWLYEITRNVFYNYLRESRTRSSNLSSLSLDALEDNPLLEMEDQALEPAEELCRREDRAELETSLTLMPAHYREVLRLYYFDNRTSREIAELLNQPVGTVKANIHRGTLLLRKVIENQKSEAM
jgi:RNA polymerase sigma-70 factor, ECF subfamily